MSASETGGLSNDKPGQPETTGALAQFGAFAPFAAWPLAALEYGVDAWQRSVLLLDILRQRGNESSEHEREGMPAVLVFDHEMLADARTLPQPVNYALLRIIPPASMPTDPAKRPFVVIDPRAGHGPGIGGFKADSEIGIALRTGHPCYFITFFRDPCPGQTIEAVARAEAGFLQIINERHPDAPGKPFVVGNCQAGWALMILAAVAPDAVGPLLVAGAPLAYWSGKRGTNPMRYSGGLLGGSWLASLTADMGNGRFDGAWLVQNFERLNPSNTLWGKLYNVYAKADTEGPRFLEFERWWGGHFLMNREEIDWIVQNLFVGNRLTAGQVRSADGKTVVDLRSIRSPVIVFASWGDNITPPQQALNWIPDLYATDEELIANDQVIVYCLHPTVGHLGIFVSAGVANREHSELFCALDLIDVLPPGLYEAKIEDIAPGTPHRDLIEGRYLVRFERRKIADILALDDGREDERAFEVVRRISEVNQHLYDTFASPLVRAASSELTAEAAREIHPSRLERSVATDANPWMAWIGALAPVVREHRHAVSQDNPFLTMEHAVSAQITVALDQYRDARDAWYEQVFEAMYQSPMMAALVGMTAQAPVNLESPVTVQLRKELAQRRLQDAQAAIGQGGMHEAFVRVLAYVADAGAAIEERPFNLLRQMAREQPEGRGRLTLAEFKSLVRQQTFIVQLDRQRALEALPQMVPEQDERRRLMVAAHRVLTVIAPLEGERLAHYREVADVLGTDHAHGGAQPAAVTVVPAAKTGNAGNGRARVARPEASHPATGGKRGAGGHSA
ncbi:hypothetical protein LMG31506_05632 [Cupriavidus yeoncheonensis]|uniref:DUF3141 domain-containing protein n=1 Tax=Cupriavidus yeoncheonensis TaxID=1462994 RepID=A0A916IZP0_9BURK|nr:DUF3141 domain-containing protein [Cupriavidus yeoncheonensis]CAG2156210.1 hypothetical protein LMG31506_05632 [Cupriavidus yeoncheonensis]